MLWGKMKYWSSNGCFYIFNDIIDFSLKIIYFPHSTNKIKHIKDKTYSQKCGGGISKKKQTPRKIYIIFFSNIITPVKTHHTHPKSIKVDILLK